MVRRLGTTLFALVALALGLAHGGAPAMPAPVSAAVAAEAPCHGADADAAPDIAAREIAAQDIGTPDCCPDDCEGGCAMTAALWLTPVQAPLLLHGPTPPTLLRSAAPGRLVDGLKRPPRPIA